MTTLAQIPAIMIDIDGSPLQQGDALVVESIRVHQALSLPSQCEICFSNPSGALANSQALLPGAEISLRVQDHTDPLFTGEVTAIEFSYGTDNNRRVYVRAYDRLHRLRLRKTVTAYVELTTQDLVQQLASEVGLSVQVHDQGPMFQRLVQFQQTDQEFMRHQTGRVGLYYYAHGDTLQLMSLTGSGGELALALGESLLEARIEMNNAGDCHSVETIAWDPFLMEQHQGSVNQARSGRVVGLDSMTGIAAGADVRVLVDRVTQDDDQATAMAQAELDRNTARRMVLSGTAEGHPGLIPGRTIDVAGVAQALSGKYVLTETVHRIDQHSGYVTELSTNPPPLQANAGDTTTTMAQVSSVDDPEGLGRVQVVYTTYNEIESDWLEVLVPGAGADKGLIALPDVGDQVLVLLLDGDPAQALVLGGLYGAQTPPDTGVEDGQIQRYNFITPGGQRIRLDDGEETIHIENSSGNFISMSPDKCLLHAQAALEIDAPGQAVTIRGQTINFERR